jgi:predicted small secreted protein
MKKIVLPIMTLCVLAFLAVSCATVGRDGLSLAEAIEQSAENIAADIPARSRVAIAAFESADGNLSEYIMGELTGALFDRRIEVVERNLEYVYRELNLQISGEVSDETAQSIGKFLGADLVITGQLTDMGNIWRYRVNAIHVERTTYVSVTRLDVAGGPEMRRLIAARKEAAATEKRRQEEAATVEERRQTEERKRQAAAWKPINTEAIGEINFSLFTSYSSNYGCELAAYPEIGWNVGIFRFTAFAGGGISYSEKAEWLWLYNFGGNAAIFFTDSMFIGGGGGIEGPNLADNGHPVYPFVRVSLGYLLSVMTDYWATLFTVYYDYNFDNNGFKLGLLFGL